MLKNYFKDTTLLKCWLVFIFLFSGTFLMIYDIALYKPSYSVPDSTEYSYQHAEKITTEKQMKNIIHKNGDYLIQGKITSDDPIIENNNKYIITIEKPDILSVNSINGLTLKDIKTTGSINLLGEKINGSAIDIYGGDIIKLKNDEKNNLKLIYTDSDQHVQHYGVPENTTCTFAVTIKNNKIEDRNAVLYVGSNIEQVMHGGYKEALGRRSDWTVVLAVFACIMYILFFLTLDSIDPDDLLDDLDSHKTDDSVNDKSQELNNINDFHFQISKTASFQERIAEARDNITDYDIKKSLKETIKLIDTIEDLEDHGAKGTNSLKKMKQIYLPQLLEILQKYINVQILLYDDPNVQKNRDKVTNIINQMNIAIKKVIIPDLSGQFSDDINVDVATLDNILDKDGMLSEDDLIQKRLKENDRI